MTRGFKGCIRHNAVLIRNPTICHHVSKEKYLKSFNFGTCLFTVWENNGRPVTVSTVIAALRKGWEGSMAEREGRRDGGGKEGEEGQISLFSISPLTTCQSQSRRRQIGGSCCPWHRCCLFKQREQDRSGGSATSCHPSLDAPFTQTASLA